MDGTEEKQGRLDRFEKMLGDICREYSVTAEKLANLKAEGREKSATYRQLFGRKMELQKMLTVYRVYGLTGGCNDENSTKE